MFLCITLVYDIYMHPSISSRQWAIQHRCSISSVSATRVLVKRVSFGNCAHLKTSYRHSVQLSVTAKCSYCILQVTVHYWRNDHVIFKYIYPRPWCLYSHVKKHEWRVVIELLLIQQTCNLITRSKHTSFYIWHHHHHHHYYYFQTKLFCADKNIKTVMRTKLTILFHM